jgi:hypothetical protein
VCTRCLLEECEQCDPAGVCLQCQQGKYLIDGQCEECSVSNCAECEDDSPAACQECQPGYYLTQGRCETCQVARCLVCQTATVCEECASFYYLAPNGTCQNCTIPNCQACALSDSNTLTCHHCRDGYEWSPEHTHCETVQEGDYE